MKIGDVLTETEVEDLPQLLEAVREAVPRFLQQVAEKNAVFKAKVGDNGRITIPTAEREALGIQKEDIVQVIIRKVE